MNGVTKLFTNPNLASQTYTQYDVAPDGRIALVERVEGEHPPSIHVIQNFPAELRALWSGHSAR